MRIVFSSPWIPIEWIKAHGHEPQGLWAIASDTTPALPEGMCAVARGLMTAAIAGGDEAFVFTTACDQMRRAADAAISPDNQRTFLFNLPATWQTKTARALYHAEFTRFGGFLERLGGRSPSNDKLREVIRVCNQERAGLLQQAGQGAMRDVAEGLVDYFAPGASRGVRRQSSAATHALQTLRESGRHEDAHGSVRSVHPEQSACDGAEARGLPSPSSSGANELAIPLALVGGPLMLTQWSLFDAIESFGGQVVLNATEPGERTLPPLLSEDLSRADLRTALADHYFDHIVDVFQRPNSRLYSWLGPRLAARHVRGLLLWVHVGCDLWRAEAESLREAFSLPLLVLESHDLRGIAPREAHRLQAFIESLR